MGDFLENADHSLLIDRGFEEAYTAFFLVDPNPLRVFEGVNIQKEA
jgi:hypothetical protein